jgi:hypothetical protein
VERLDSSNAEQDLLWQIAVAPRCDRNNVLNGISFDD